MHLLAVVIYFLAVIHGLYSGKCPPIKVRKDTIIRSRESIRNGAKLLYRTDVESSRECYELCCNRKSCSVAVMHYKKEVDDSGYPLTIKTCFVFSCGTPNRCSFMNHTGYAVIEMQRDANKAKPQTEPENPIPTEEKCPPGSPVAMCSNDPCDKATCPGVTDAHCRPSFCGGCSFVFYNSQGQKLQCKTKPKVTEEPKKSKHKNEGDSIKKPQDSKKISSKGETGKEDPGKETEDKEVGGNFKEETVVVEPEDTGGKPTEEPLYPGAKDPHAVKEWRTWFNPKDPNKVANTVKPATNTKQSILIGLSDKFETGNAKKGIKKVIVKDSSFSLALTVALIICIVILMSVIIKLKCLGPKKKKKFAVDDGDYLINGMYL
eukprot:gene13730-4650_t